jgi:RNA polymerase sigma factor (sigma-70 family)
MEQDPPEDSPARLPRPLTPEELDDFYKRYYRGLIRYLTSRHRLSKEDAADIAQEVFLLAIEKLDPEGGNPKAWLTEVANRMAANLRRKKQRRSDLLERWR